MSDVSTLARTARERLAAGLAALQAPGVPDPLSNVAEPVAQAMGLMHHIESRGIDADAAQQALVSVRHALGALQGCNLEHPAAVEATENVAASLNLVHSLTELTRSVLTATPGAFDLRAAPPPQIHPGAPARAGRPHASGAEASPPPARTASNPAQPPQGVTPNAEAGHPSEPTTDASMLKQVEAALGAHSTTNFYKGLSGNDIIQSGGLFIATYNILELGEQVQLRVSMPGGYEFEALGVVTWTREPRPGGSLAPLSHPGYGVRFVEIGAEAKQLVYRYVRNREPLFYDDL